MSLSQDLSHDASSAITHDALERAAETIKSCGVEVESVLLLVVHKDDAGRVTTNGHQEGSVFSSIGAAETWLVSNTRLEP